MSLFLHWFLGWANYPMWSTWIQKNISCSDQIPISLGWPKKKNENLKSKRLNLIVRLTHTHNTHQTHSHRDRQQRDSTHSTADSPDSSHSSSHWLTDATVRSQSIASPWCADLCTLTTAAACSIRPLDHCCSCQLAPPRTTACFMVYLLLVSCLWEKWVDLLCFVSIGT